MPPTDTHTADLFDDNSQGETGLLQHFAPTDAAAQARLAAVRPGDYARTRNHLDGAVTRLSPYLTHGLLSLPQVLQAVLQRAGPRGLEVQHKFVCELGWRAFFQHVWAHRGDGILQSLHPGPLPDDAYAREMPTDVRAACTGVPVIDQAVRTLYATGWLHNHARMWLASYLVHVRKVHWRVGADWLYGHLLDGDLASNHLSWQWVAGTGSHKPYLFNAENVARYAAPHWHSPGTVIDADYATLDRMARHSGAWPGSDRLRLDGGRNGEGEGEGDGDGDRNGSGNGNGNGQEIEVGNPPGAGTRVGGRAGNQARHDAEHRAAGSVDPSVNPGVNEGDSHSAEHLAERLTEPPLLHQALAGCLDLPSPEAVRGRAVRLLHPWSLAAPPPDDGRMCIGVLCADFHRAWPWREARWRFVIARLRELCEQVWWGDATVLQQALAAAHSVTGQADPHLRGVMPAPWDAWLHEQRPALFVEPGALCHSFSQYWRRVTRGMVDAEALLSLR
jgi:hypothetical protein